MYTTSTLAALTSLPPEIHTMIFRDTDLKQQDRRNCALACRALHQICTPFLWQAVKVKDSSRLKAFKEDDTQQALLRNVSHVRELHLLYGSLFHIFLPRKKDTTPLGYKNMSDSERWRKEVEEGYLPALCTNLQALQLHHFGDSMEDPYGGDGRMSRDREDLYEYPDLESNIAALVRQNPRLVRLEFGPFMTEVLLIPMVTEDLPHLEFLDINMPFSHTELKYILENLPEGIKEVCLVVYPTFRTVSSEFTPLISARCKSHRTLTSLRIGGLDGLEEYVLLPFLETCNKLRHFDTGKFDCFKNKKIADALLKLGMEVKNDPPRE